MLSVNLHNNLTILWFSPQKNSKKEKRSKNSQEKPKEVKKEAQTEHKQAAETEKKRISKLPLKSLQGKWIDGGSGLMIGYQWSQFF